MGGKDRPQNCGRVVSNPRWARISSGFEKTPYLLLFAIGIVNQRLVWVRINEGDLT